MAKGDLATKVFISHSFSDEGWVREFARSLEKNGINVLHDHHEIQPGESVREALEKGMRQSSLIVLFVTPDTVDRPNRFFEIGAAIGMGKRVVPILARNLNPALLPSSLRERRYLVQSSPEATAREFISQEMATL